MPAGRPFDAVPLTAFGTSMSEEEAKAAEKLDAKLKIELHWLQRGVTARRRRNQGRLANQQVSFKPEIGYLQEIVLKHCSIPCYAERAAVVAYLLIHKLT